jgi:hypothetical protein
MPEDIVARVEAEIEDISARIEAQKALIKKSMVDPAAVSKAVLDLRALHVRLGELQTNLRKSRDAADVPLAKTAE